MLTKQIEPLPAFWANFISVFVIISVGEVVFLAWQAAEIWSLSESSAGPWIVCFPPSLEWLVWFSLGTGLFSGLLAAIGAMVYNLITRLSGGLRRVRSPEAKS